MRKNLLLLILSIGLFTTADAQFGNLLKKAKDKTKQRVDQKIDNEMDKTLDKAEGKKTTAPAKEPASSSSSSTEEKDGEEPVDNSLKSFTKFDFIPGDSIIYAEDFQQDEIGELPLNWNTNGTGEVTTLDKYQGNWLRLHKSFSYLTGNTRQFGTDYTVEFDLILKLKSNGWLFPEFRVGLFATGEKSTTANEFLKDYVQKAAIYSIIYPGEGGTSKLRIHSQMGSRTFFHSESRSYEALDKSYGKPMHIAIQVQKERFRMWINGDKLFDAPKAVPMEHVMNQLFFEVTHTNYPEEQYGVFVGNLKIATGKPDTRHKLIDEGKFSTTGILFDFQSAVIKPESYGVVKEIAGVLKEHGSIKVKVIGHTSSDGDDKANMELSVKRAAAVKTLLTTEFGVDASRIETEGKGETQPIADNKTREGKSANRRVEFIKL